MRALTEVARRSARRTIGDLDGVEVTGVTLATTDLHPGDLFVGIHGVRRHGAEFAADAVRGGAVAILTDEAGAEIAADAGVPILVTDDPRGALADISSFVYGTEIGRAHV